MNPLKDCASVIQGYFCKGYGYGKKADLSKTFGNRKKMWETTHFSDISKQP